MVKRQLVCNVFHNIKSDDFYIGTASAIYCATGFPLPLNRSQMGAMLGISEDTMIEKVVYNDFDCASMTALCLFWKRNRQQMWFRALLQSGRYARIAVGQWSIVEKKTRTELSGSGIRARTAITSFVQEG